MTTGNAGLGVLLVLLVLGAASCSHDPDARLTEVTRQSLSAQARQNERMAEQSQEVVTASRRLVEADAESRRELVEAHRSLQDGLQKERSRVDRQRDDLEQERRRLASRRQTDPVIADAIQAVGILLACLTPLLLAAYVLYTMNRRSEDADAVDALNQILIGEIVSAQPRLLPPPEPSPRRLVDQSGSEPERNEPAAVGDE